jgi:hypothetical protein
MLITAAAGEVEELMLGTGLGFEIITLFISLLFHT